MKSYIALAAISGLASALPAAAPQESDPIVRTLPPLWTFSLASYNGPGCPKPDGKDRETRLTYGQNTMDGSEIYHWFVAYPKIKAKVGGDVDEAHSWCETTIAYKEFKDAYGKEPGSDYTFRLHKNDTRIISTYDLEEGVTAEWKFTYSINEKEACVSSIVDELAIDGPFTKLPYQWETGTELSESTKPVPAAKCGATTFSFRTDLYLKANKEGAKGVVQGEPSKTADGTEVNYGIQQGFSYDWQKCSQ
ncbi:hypothetical protein DM02DRAFT_517539 [Periconia macrospinosa]|uniref:Uncharacterized protein n=1 Tax=Periconia macrospinosa TaxID=97972 RepID=A0A2V1E399_9PLEO|nr:hypothetical protein DM02DRAFT_517539 [Periconia macrospinosa]